MKLKKKDFLPIILLGIFSIFWAVLAVNPANRLVWLAENFLSVLGIIFLVFTYRKFRFSNTSYILLFVFMVLHTIGSYYTYSKMPLFEWLRELFDLSRNHYDRLVHFLFGAVFYFPLREFVSRKLNINHIWSYLIPFLIIVSFKAIYEIIEYLAVVVTNDNRFGSGFLGMQGDQWDAQNDILAGTLGAGTSWVVSKISHRNKQK
ncbi:MAG: DUF2238 domain-containing protein [Nanoarchaeota archaeon]